MEKKKKSQTESETGKLRITHEQQNVARMWATNSRENSETEQLTPVDSEEQALTQG